MRASMPVLFIGHGSPLNAVADNAFSRFLRELGKSLPKPRAILVVSAHWETPEPRVLTGEAPRTIHDFRGFPQALFDIRYAAAGAPLLSARVAELTGAGEDSRWGFDHGTWSVLTHLYPQAEVPVVQLSLGALSPRAHYELARKLKPLREEGVLLVASGNITHNLRELSGKEDAPAAPWAAAFDEKIRAALVARDLPTLLLETGNEEEWNRAHPRIDHYLPLLYALGAGEDSGSPSFPYEGFQYGTLSMRAVRYG